MKGTFFAMEKVYTTRYSTLIKTKGLKNSQFLNM